MKRKIEFLVLELALLGGIAYLFGINYLSKPEITYIEEKYYSKSELEESFKKDQSNKINGIEAMVTSHHFLAKNLIAKCFSNVNGEKIERVIIVSPDHFKQIKEKDCLAMTANIGWKTDFGQIEPDVNGIKKIEKNTQVKSDINIFGGEHGIFTLIPFVKNYLPRAKIIPMVLKTKNDYTEFYNLGEKVARCFDKSKTLLVISSDFSHYIPFEEAVKKDSISLSALKSKDVNQIENINNDCPQCIAFLFGYLNKNSEFNLVKNTNSFEISGKDENYVTSYINAYFIDL